MAKSAQLDIFDDDPGREARVWRIQAEEALRAFQFPDAVRLERHAYYVRKAEELERRAGKPALTPPTLSTVRPGGCIQLPKDKP
ncbi:TPA: hypothetical protein R4K21_003625 [Stenotrophomonas maltophilia]|nr:hypothetical protein [Stenotrophomonas maltophilia]